MAVGAHDYAQTALAAARWVDSTSVIQGGLRRWPVYGDDPTTLGVLSLYGEAGVAFFLTEAALHFQEPWLAASTRDAALACTSLRGDDDGYWGLHTGLAGAVFAASHAATALDDAQLRAAADAGLDRLVAAAVPAGDGVEWPAHPDGRGPWAELYHGNAGIGLALLALAEDLGRDDAVDLALRAGERLLELAITVSTGLWWRSRPDDGKPAPNVAHGTTGIALFLAALGLATGDRRFVDAAEAGGNYLLSIARTDDGGCAVHHHAGDGEDLYTLGWCSGPPGIGCLFVRLHEATQDTRWLDWATRAARTVSTSGVPQRVYPGFWDNVAQCCGSAGVADFFLGLHSITGDPSHLGFGNTMLDDIVDRAVWEGDRARWHNIEHRDPEPALPAQTGYMQGASGIGLTLLRGHRQQQGAPTAWLPSWPFSHAPRL